MKKINQINPYVLTAAVLAPLTILTAGLTFAQSNKIVSISSEGGSANNDSYYSLISDDGRYITFQSEAGNLVDDDHNNQYDIFRRDQITGITELVSVSRFGGSGSRLSLAPAISGNGRFITFATDGSDMVPNDTNGTWDIFVRDMKEGTTERVSVDSDGRQANSRNDSAAITPDGRYVVFHSLHNFVPEDNNGGYDIYLHDRQSKKTILVSTDKNGNVGNGASIMPQLTTDARKIVFMSSASNFIPGDGNGIADVFVKNLVTGAIERVNESTYGNESIGETTWPYINGDGTVVAFNTKSWNMVPGDTNNNWDLFTRDLTTGITTRVNVRPDGAQADGYTRSPVGFSRDGRFLAYASLCTDLVPNDTNGFQDIFIRDLVDEVTHRVAYAYTGEQTGDDNFVPDLSADARYITYTSEAEDLVARDGNFRRDIFVMDWDASLYLTQDFLVRGEVTDFEAFAADSNEKIYFLYTTKSVGNGPCPKQLGGLCLDLAGAIKILGSAQTDNAGRAVLSIRVPNNAPIITIHTQAAVIRGANGTNSAKSNTVSAPVWP